MNRIPLGYLALPLAAICACAPVDDEREVVAVQLGQLEQEMVTPVGYGADSSQRRCIPSRGYGPGSFCDVPAWKHVRVGLASNHGCPGSWSSRIEAAMVDMQWIGIWSGWSVTIMPEGELGEVGGITSSSFWRYSDSFPVVCRDVAAPALAATRVWKNPIVDYSCDDTITFIGNVPLCPTCDYEICAYRHGFLMIDTPAIMAVPGWADLTATQRVRFAENVILHEFMHVMGLGHSTTGGGPGLMAAGPRTVGGKVDPATWGTALTITSAELEWLTEYDPTFDDTVVVP